MKSNRLPLSLLALCPGRLRLPSCWPPRWTKHCLVSQSFWRPLRPHRQLDEHRISSAGWGSLPASPAAISWWLTSFLQEHECWSGTQKSSKNSSSNVVIVWIGSHLYFCFILNYWTANPVVYKMFPLTYQKIPTIFILLRSRRGGEFCINILLWWVIRQSGLRKQEVIHAIFRQEMILAIDLEATAYLILGWLR